MSVGDTPSLTFIADTVGDVEPHAMSEMRGIRFAIGNSPTSGAISLSNFRNQTLTSKYRRIYFDPYPDHVYGEDVIVSPDGLWVAINTVYYSNDPINKNNVKIFARSGVDLTLQQTITSTDSQSSDFIFGYAFRLSYDATYLIVAVTTSQQGAFAAIYTRSGDEWIRQQLLIPTPIPRNNAPRSPRYRVEISHDGVWAITSDGAEYTGEYYNNRGAIHVFKRSGSEWSYNRLINSNEVPDFISGYGGMMSISGDGMYIVIGSHFNPAILVYVRTGDTWALQQRFVPNNQNDSAPILSWFQGNRCNISGDGSYLIVGSPTSYIDGEKWAGCATIFKRSGSVWSEQYVIKVPGSRLLGYATVISSDGTTALVSQYEGGGTNSTPVGVAYIFNRSGEEWVLKQTIQPPELPNKYTPTALNLSITFDGMYLGIGPIPRVFQDSYYLQISEHQ